ncbi:hypothetical protein DTW90_30580 [Neorhizobium sp. P12A]|nr:hypothetical protein DTW90_30580 [Neorhizobium sp. P12A]
MDVDAELVIDGLDLGSCVFECIDDGRRGCDHLLDSRNNGLNSRLYGLNNFGHFGFPFGELALEPGDDLREHG